jgi:hypothetical protein
MGGAEILMLMISIICLIAICHFIVAFLLAYTIDELPTFYTPATIYQLTKMNWFGCITIWVVLFPFGFIFELGGFLKWLFTVGRKD